MIIRVAQNVKIDENDLIFDFKDKNTDLELTNKTLVGSLLTDFSYLIDELYNVETDKTLDNYAHFLRFYIPLETRDKFSFVGYSDDGGTLGYRKTFTFPSNVRLYLHYKTHFEDLPDYPSVYNLYGTKTDHNNNAFVANYTLTSEFIKNQEFKFEYVREFTNSAYFNIVDVLILSNEEPSIIGSEAFDLLDYYNIDLSDLSIYDEIQSFVFHMQEEPTKNNDIMLINGSSFNRYRKGYRQGYIRKKKRFYR